MMDSPAQAGAASRSHRGALSRQSEEFRSVQYTLKLALAAANLDVADGDHVPGRNASGGGKGGGSGTTSLRAWSMLNPRVRLQFDRFSQGLAHVHGWVDVNGYSAADLDQIFNEGLYASAAEPRRVIVGALQPKEAYPPLKGQKKFLYCRVTIGRPYPVKEDELDDTPVPRGFHSNYLCGSSTAFPEVTALGLAMSDASPVSRRRSSEARTAGARAGAARVGGAVDAAGSASTTASIDNFHHEYVVANGAQILPLYAVQFTVGKSKVADGRRACQLCEDAPATVHCEKCDAVFCDKCDADTHRMNKLLKRHLRQPVTSIRETQSVAERKRAIRQRLGPEYDALSACPIHGSQQLQFYDPVLNVPVCVHCKMVGSHSSGAAVHNRLVGIDDAYDKALRESMTPDTVLAKRREQLQRGKEHIAALSRKVKANAADTEKEIYAILQAALQTNAALAQRKLRILQSVEVDLLREMFSLEWMECYLRDQRDALPPAAFLKLWGQHTQLRATQYDFTYRPPESLVRVKPDITIAGTITVSAGDDSHVPRGPRPGVGRDFLDDNGPRHLSPMTRRFVSVLLDEKTGVSGSKPLSSSSAYSAAGARAGGGGSDNEEEAAEEAQLRAQAQVLSLAATAPKDLAEFQRRADDVRRGVFRSMQRAASFPDVFPSVAAAARGDDGDGGDDDGGSGGSSGTGGDGHDDDDADHDDDDDAAGRRRSHRDGGGGRAANGAAPGSGRRRSGGAIAPMFDVAVQPRYRLAEIAAQRVNASPSFLDDLAASGFSFFSGSRLLADGHAAAELTMCLPMATAVAGAAGAANIYCVRLFDSADHGRSAARVLAFGDRFVKQHSLSRHDVGVVFLARAADGASVGGKGKCFGAYVDEMWPATEGWCGSPESFLFSLTHGAVLPNHRRLPTAGALYRGNGGLLRFGMTDLKLHGDGLRECTSEVEGSFGLGFKPNSTGARQFLAGSHHFEVVDLEVWALVPADLLQD